MLLLGSADAKSDGGARLRRVSRTPTPYQLAQRRATVAAQAERSSESDEESDGSRSNSGDGRVNLEQIDADPGASSWSSPSSAQDGQAAAQNQLPEEPDIAITADTMSDRYDLPAMT